MIRGSKREDTETKLLEAGQKHHFGILFYGEVKIIIKTNN